MELRKATRKTVKLRMGLSGASGFGKTYSALLLAFGMTNDWSKIAVIDTENGSAELYSNLGEYNGMTISAPYSPERYIEAIKTCENANMDVIIIDSITQEWEGQGGCLDILNSFGGKYQDWAKVTPRHQKFIDSILQSKCHVITTVRRKQDYEMTKENGKTIVQKVGTKEITREGFEYEITLNLEFLNDSHLVKASKDRTGLFMDEPEFVITAETGKRILQWCENGVDELELAVSEIKSAKSLDELKTCWLKWNQYQKNETFSATKDEIKKKLTPELTPAIEKMLTQAIALLDTVDSIEKVNATVTNMPELQKNDLFIKSVNAAKARLTPVKAN